MGKIKVNVKNLLKERGENPSQLSRKADLAIGTAYDWGNKDFFQDQERIEAGTLAKLCKHFGQPISAIIEFVPDRQK